MAKGKTTKTVTMKLNRNGTMTLRSTGGFDLRKLFSAEELEGVNPYLPQVRSAEERAASRARRERKAGAE